MMVEKIKVTKEDIEVYLESARSRIHSAEVLLKAQGYNDAISRAYYAFFDAARAALLSEGFIVKTHGGLLTLFNKYFIKTKKMPHIFGKYLARAFKARQEADYEARKKFDKKAVEDAIRLAKEFVNEISKLVA